MVEVSVKQPSDVTVNQLLPKSYAGETGVIVTPRMKKIRVRVLSYDEVSQRLQTRPK